MATPTYLRFCPCRRSCASSTRESTTCSSRRRHKGRTEGSAPARCQRTVWSRTANQIPLRAFSVFFKISASFRFSQIYFCGILFLVIGREEHLRFCVFRVRAASLHQGKTRFYKSEASMIHSILALVLGAAHFAEALDFCMPNICSRLAVPKAGVSIQRVFRQSHRSFENASSLPCTTNSLLPCYGAFAFARHRTGRTTVPEDIPVPAQQNRLLQHQETHTRSHPSTAGGYGRA